MDLTWEEFQKVELRVGTIVKVDSFPKARKPAYQLEIDFGEKIGLRKSSAQLTVNYSKDDLLGRQILAVVNFPPKQIANFISECLVTGFEDEEGNIVLSGVERNVPNGAKLL